MAGTGTMSARQAKRREITMMWMKQLLEAQEKQGTAKAAAAAWIGAVYALRAASRLDGNADWGKVGDEMIGNLESVYIELFGKEGERVIEAGRRLLQTHEKPQLTIAKIPKIKKPVPAKRPMLRKPLFKRPLLSRAAALRKIEAARAAVARPKANVAKAKAVTAKAGKKSGGKKGKKGKR